MAWSAAAKAIALVLFLAALAGATYAVSETLDIHVEQQPIVIEPVHTERQATPGHTVSYLITVENRGASERTVVVAVDGAAQGRSAPAVVGGNSSIAVFVPVEVPANAAIGEHALAVRVSDSQDKVLRAREGALTLRVLPEAPGLEIGDRAEMQYIGRLADTGRAFAANDPRVVGAPFLKTDQYQYNPAALPVSTQPRNVVQGIYEGILGMQAGETRTLTFGFEKGYGPPSENDTVPRREVIERTLVARNEVQRVPRETFNDFITENDLGRPEDYAVGSMFNLTDEQNTWPYRIVTMTDQIVEYRLGAQPGDKFTIYGYWPLGSEIERITDTEVVFKTSPTTPMAPEGACPPDPRSPHPGCITVRPEWPSMSTLDAPANDTHVVVRHDPPTNFRYTTTLAGQTREIVVLDVGADEIIVAVAAQHPLAGRALTFDVTLLSITKPGSG